MRLVVVVAPTRVFRDFPRGRVTAFQSLFDVCVAMFGRCDIFRSVATSWILEEPLVQGLSSSLIW